MKIAVIENPRPPSAEHYNDVANAPLSASLNSGYAMAVARESGWETAHLDFTRSRESDASLAAVILAAAADIVLIHWTYSWGNEAAVRNLLRILKSDDCGLIGAFGLFPTISRDKLMNYTPHLDFIIAGEFEQTLEELLRSFARAGRLPKLSGLFLRDSAFVPRAVISDPSQIPIPDDLGGNRDHPALNIAASRGCFGVCSFCFISGYYGCNRRRERSIASLEQELGTRLLRRDLRELYFIDPTFIGYGSGQLARIRSIGNLVHSVSLPFGFETRVDTVNEELVTILAGCGASSIFLGIESGCDSVLKRMQKKISRNDIVSAVRCIRESGIHLNIGFIMFEPDTTLSELRDNFDFLEQLGLLSDHDLTINLLYHSQIVLHGSGAWTRFEQEGRLLLDDRLPFEARYRFRDERVVRVCAAMKGLATDYFIRTRELYGKSGGDACGPVGQPGHGDSIKGGDVNRLLKEAFLGFVAAASSSGSQLSNLEKRISEELSACLPETVGKGLTADATTTTSLLA